MADINLAIISGRVGQDPEIKTFEGGAMKSSFSIATTKKWVTKEGEKKESTQWHRIETWGGLTKLVEGWVKKGYAVTVQGEIQHETYTDRDGVERTVTKIKADQISIGTTVSNGDRGQAPQSQPAQSQNTNPALLRQEEEDDLPF